MNARLCVEQELHSFCEWIVLNGYCIASWMKWRYFASPRTEGSSVRSFRNVLPCGRKCYGDISTVRPTCETCPVSHLHATKVMQPDSPFPNMMCHKADQFEVRPCSEAKSLG